MFNHEHSMQYSRTKVWKGAGSYQNQPRVREIPAVQVSGPCLDVHFQAAVRGPMDWAGSWFRGL